jgi:hypothetical protein
MVVPPCTYLQVVGSLPQTDWIGLVPDHPGGTPALAARDRAPPHLTSAAGWSKDSPATEVNLGFLGFLNPKRKMARMQHGTIDVSSVC